MEFNEKLQELRKQKGLTQEELAKSLYVSRTAISKWESGRGYPSIDSLKAISRFFSVSIDDLLSADEILTIAEDQHRQKEAHFCDLVFGLLDLSCAMFFFLPFFGQTIHGVIQEASLLALTELQTYLTVAYYTIVIGMVSTGVLTLALRNCPLPIWKKYKNKISFILSTISVVLFMISKQPYAATLVLIFLTIKWLIMVKRR